MDAIGNSTGLDLSGATCVKIVATRDSVAAGDDIDAPHERQFSFKASTSVAQAHHFKPITLVGGRGPLYPGLDQ